MRYSQGVISDSIRVLLADPFPVREIDAPEPAPQTIYRYAPGALMGQPPYPTSHKMIRLKTHQRTRTLTRGGGLNAP